jgi:integrase
MGRKLTAKGIDAIKARAVRQEIGDSLLPGLYLVIQPSGVRSWAVRYRHRGASRKYTIGQFPAFSLAQAREAAGGILRAVAAGRDPATEKKAKPAEAGTVESTVADFVKRHVDRNYRPGPRQQTARLLRLYVVDKWGDRKIADITRADVRDMLEKIVSAGTPIAANRVFSTVRGFFNWCLQHEIVATSPCTGIRPPGGREVSRDRILNDAELRAVWNAADQLGLYGRVIQLLILTGQRRSEVANMEWREVDLANRLWTLPKERVKNGRAHQVPLPPQAIAIIEQLPRVSEQYVISLFGRKPLQGFGEWARQIQKFAGLESEWVVHDLRRSVASGMAKLGVQLPVIERILNHTSGSFAGIVGVYQRHEFAEEKRKALQKWADHVEEIVDGDDRNNVVTLRA